MGTVKSLYEEKRIEDALTHYRRLLDEGSASTEDHAYGALASKARGDLPGARWALERIDMSTLDGRLLGQTRFVYGVVLQDLGESRSAIDEMELFLREMDRYDDLRTFTTGPALYNLALSLRSVGRLAEAFDMYAKSISEFRRESMKAYLHNGLVNLAWVACLLDRKDVARQAIEEARPLALSTEQKYHQRQGEAYVLAVEGKQHESALICSDLTSAGDAVPSEVRCHAFWLGGLIAMSFDQLEYAETLALEAITVAEQAKNYRCLRDASDLLRSIRLQQRKPGG